MNLYPRVEPWNDDSSRYRLAKLSPIGLGTDRVESLSSYLTRLATAHWVSPTNLYKVLSAEAHDGDVKSLSVSSRLDGYSKLSRHVAVTLNLLSSVDVDFHDLTLNAWRAVFANNCGGLLRDHLAWCADCHEEDRLDGSPSYNRLLWCIRSVSQCPVHKCALLSCCEVCGCRQAYVTANAHIGYCQQCGNDLAQPPKQLSRVRIVSEDRAWKSNACTSLLHATQNGTRFDRDTLLLRLKDCLRDYRGSPKRMARSLNLVPGSIRAWIDHGNDPNFEFFLDVCFRLDIPPLQFFLRSGTLPINRPRVIRQVVAGRAPALSEEEIESARCIVQRVLDSDSDIQRTADVAEKAGITRRLFLYHLPDEYSLAVRKVFERRAREKRERDAERIRQLKRRAYSLTRRGIYPSQRKMLANGIVRPSDLRVPLVKQKLLDIQDEFIEQLPEYQQNAKFMHCLRISRRRSPTRKELADQVRLQSAHGRLR